LEDEGAWEGAETGVIYRTDIFYGKPSPIYDFVIIV